MKKRTNFIAVIFAMGIIFSCSKSDVSEDSETSCYVCSTASESIDVCEANGNFIVDGDTIDNPNGASLEDYIRAIESNPNNDPELEGIKCKRK